VSRHNGGGYRLSRHKGGGYRGWKMGVRVSANLIAVNEQRNIARCLRSLSWVDEIVVVDAGSDDGTVDIARGFTDHVHIHPFDDYSSQRNRAIERSSGDWILSIDCDEWVSANLADEIRKCVTIARPHFHGFWVPIRSRIFGRPFRYSGTRGERKMRLFRRDCGRWKGAVHETVELDGMTASLRNAIEHNSTPDVDAYLRKLIRYSTLESESLLASGLRPHWWQPWLGPMWQFARLYFGKLGFLDGPEGFRFCVLSGWQVWITYQKFLEQYNDRIRSMVRVDVPEPKESCHGPAIAAA
jgi:glycosyltransferase involved in cell wall biosynthesis